VISEQSARELRADLRRVLSEVGYPELIAEPRPGDGDLRPEADALRGLVELLGASLAEAGADGELIGLVTELHELIVQPYPASIRRSFLTDTAPRFESPSAN
jgi:hypothetical protein